MITSPELRDQLYNNNSGKGFLLEDEMALPSLHLYNVNHKIKLKRLDHQFGELTARKRQFYIYKNVSKLQHPDYRPLSQCPGISRKPITLRYFNNE